MLAQDVVPGRRRGVGELAQAGARRQTEGDGDRLDLDGEIARWAGTGTAAELVPQTS